MENEIMDKIRELGKILALESSTMMNVFPRMQNLPSSHGIKNTFELEPISSEVMVLRQAITRLSETMGGISEGLFEITGEPKEWED